MTMLVNVLWAAGALVVAAYMVVALLRPDKF
ncbi:MULTISPECIES: potassium-transporting ATPase subunit F [Caulobacter]|uniref:K+-transporting ATPase KdpF subunit n=1 Tax=Caulobacter rhizosphaerae TaxID=2010972 RepID=A0ABU1N2Q3_9CAUL|nr:MULTISPECIES: potassium-transporting ATPase subunit F [Caulobacter]MDR6532734.1 K+-transporting ATPase KdpF subunit [Caulobacter rhizosphaerae]HWU14047.1 potassium-transporting ATPase subunit F [Caulobacter sp.]HWW25943.1 potassium-transporting ATPase subunit F [Caulobacter sp.]